jgi:ATP phosphoribosyltransferase
LPGRSGDENTGGVNDQQKDRTVIRIAIPNKGRLSEVALDLLGRAGLRTQGRSDRALVASLGRDFQAVFVRAGDIPEFLADGAAELGITGADIVRESGREVAELLDLGFGRCRLVVAVREESGITDPSQVPAEARVATSFPGISRRYFEGLGIPIRIASISGAVEITPHLGVADVIVDLTSTGSTLRVNGLRDIGTVMESTARLVVRPDVMEDEAARTQIEGLLMALESVLRAQEKRYLMANVPRARLEEVKRIIPGLSGPTIVDVLDGNGWVAAHAVVDADAVYETIADLKGIGAEGILVTPIERLMP